MNENCPLGGTIPEFHPCAFEVDVCETESVFVHVTVEPTATVRSSGLKAWFPNVSAPLGIVTSEDDTTGGGAGAGAGDGVGDGVVGEGEPPPPQAVANIKTADRATIRSFDIGSSERCGCIAC